MAQALLAACMYEVIGERAARSGSAASTLSPYPPESCNLARCCSVLYSVSEAAMNKLKGFRLAAVLLTALFLGPGVLQAQRQGPVTSARPSARALPARPANTVRVSPVHAPPGSVVRARGHITGGTPFNDAGSAFASGFGGFGGFGDFGGSQQLLNSTPGFGFNNANLDDLGIKAAIDPETQWRLAIAERLLRDDRGFGGFFGTGGYILDGGGYYTAPEEPSSEPAAAAPAPQPQIIVVQVPAAPNQQGAASAAPAESQEQQPALPDVGQFTLVLRNGTKIEAIAFTRKSDSIVYIAVDGSRKTLAVADLDSAATQRVNEERGTPLNLSL